MTTNEQAINTISFRDMVRHLALNLRGKLSVSEGNHIIYLENTFYDCFVRITFARAEENENQSYSLMLETGSLRAAANIISHKWMQLDHLYVTWESSLMVSICYANNERFFLINIFANATAQILDGLDRRQDSKESEVDVQAQNRRRFYYLGEHPGKV